MDWPTSGVLHEIQCKAQCTRLPDKYTVHENMVTGTEKKLVLKVQFQFQPSNIEEQVSKAFR